LPNGLNFSVNGEEENVCNGVVDRNAESADGRVDHRRGSRPGEVAAKTSGNKSFLHRDPSPRFPSRADQRV
jgi:hypothetical protein